MKLLRIALEENQPEEIDDELITDNNDEADILKANNDIEANFDEDQNITSVLESLDMYATNVRELIKNNNCTRETVNLINLGVQQQYNRIGYKPVKVSMESMGLSIEQEHQLVLEGIGDVVNRISQKMVMQNKHVWNAVADLFKSTKTKLAKYENKLANGKAEFNEKKKLFKETTHTGSLNDLWYHFSNDEGQPDDIINAIKDDLALSKYILETYPIEMIDSLKKLTSVIKSGKQTDIKDFISLVRNIEKLPNSGDQFKKTYIGGKPYLSVTGLEITKGSERNTLSIGSADFSKLAMLATPNAVSESGSFAHGMQKVAIHYLGHVGAAVDLILSKTIKLSTSEIGQVFDFGETYITNVRKYLSLENSLKVANDSFIDAIEKLNKESLPESRQLIRQIEQFGNNILYCFQTPATAEIARSLKGSKYCHYLGLRMIFNAK